MKLLTIVFYLVVNSNIEKIVVHTKSKQNCVYVAENIMKSVAEYKFPHTSKNGYYTKQNKLIIGFSCYE